MVFYRKPVPTFRDHTLKMERPGDRSCAAALKPETPIKAGFDQSRGDRKVTRMALQRKRMACIVPTFCLLLPLGVAGSGGVGDLTEIVKGTPRGPRQKNELTPAIGASTIRLPLIARHPG